MAILKRHVSEFAPVEKQAPPRTRTKHYRKGGHGSWIIGETTPTGPHGLFNNDDSCASEFAGHGRRKKRSGVSNTLMPPRKYLKNYEMKRGLGLLELLHQNLDTSLRLLPLHYTT